MPMRAGRQYGMLRVKSEKVGLPEIASRSGMGVDVAESEGFGYTNCMLVSMKFSQPAGFVILRATRDSAL